MCVRCWYPPLLLIIPQYQQRRQQENAQRQSRGEPPLPEEDISKMFKAPQAPPRMDTLLISGTSTLHSHTDLPSSVWRNWSRNWSIQQWMDPFRGEWGITAGLKSPHHVLILMEIRPHVSDNHQLWKRMIKCWACQYISSNVINGVELNFILSISKCSQGLDRADLIYFSWCVSWAGNSNSWVIVN